MKKAIIKTAKVSSDYVKSLKKQPSLQKGEIQKKARTNYLKDVNILSTAVREGRISKQYADSTIKMGSRNLTKKILKGEKVKNIKLEKYMPGYKRIKNKYEK